LTNEVGAFDKITLLKNGAGMFIIQRLKAECEESLGRDVSWKEIDEMASSKTENIPLFLVQNSNYFNPISMSDEIWNYFKQTNQVTADKDWITLFRSFNESMACSYAETIREIEEVTNNSFDSIYMVGGGSRNSLLCQLSANYSRKNLFLGGKESTSLGTILAQIKYFEKEKTILQLRNIISSELSDKHYEYENIESSDVLDRYKKLIIKGENV
jgi:sugar (pentulose or hexulose) kinase